MFSVLEKEGKVCDPPSVTVSSWFSVIANTWHYTIFVRILKEEAF